jgi:hypothetical protein
MRSDRQLLGPLLGDGLADDLVDRGAVGGF